MEKNAFKKVVNGLIEDMSDDEIAFADEQYKRVFNGELVYMTRSEIADRKAEETASSKTQSTNDWKVALARSDATMPRYVEDLIDVLTDEQRDALAPTTKDAYDDKKQLRADIPDDVETALERKET